MIPFILLLFGFMLVFFEFYLPGGVMGAAGVVLVLISVVLFANQYESVIGTILFIGVAVGGLSLLFRYALWRIRSAAPEKSVYSDDNQEGYYASKFDVNLVGKKGIVSTELRPGGYLQVDGKRHGAISKGGYIEVGVEVDIIGGQGESLIVKPSKKEKTS